jgi:hypothetical protein
MAPTHCTRDLEPTRLLRKPPLQAAAAPLLKSAPRVHFRELKHASEGPKLAQRRRRGRPDRTPYSDVIRVHSL